MSQIKTGIVTGAVILLTATPVFALDLNAGANINANANTNVGGASVGVDAKIQARMDKAKDHANQEIDRRVTKLNDLITRSQAMVRLSAEIKTSIATYLQSQVTALASLKTKVDADTDIETLKADIKSVTQSYRIFLLVIPQGHITITADKLKFVASNAATLAAKLQTRIDAAAAAGKDVASLKTLLSDMQAKTADASVQADASLALIANLAPDEGDKTKAEANNQALKDARVKIKAGLKDVQTARQDAHSIVKGLATLHLEASASSTTSVQ